MTSALTDDAVAHQALEWRRKHAAATALAAEAKLHADAVIVELVRRKYPADKPWVFGGLSVSVVAAVRTKYRLADVKSRVTAAIFSRVKVTTISTTAVNAEVKAGRIDATLAATLLAEAAEVTTAAPHIVVTGDAAPSSNF